MVLNGDEPPGRTPALPETSEDDEREMAKDTSRFSVAGRRHAARASDSGVCQEIQSPVLGVS